MSEPPGQLSTRLAEAAEEAMALASKWHTLMGCVRHQYPELLSDPALQQLEIQDHVTHQAFERRLQEIAATAHR